VSPRRGTLQKRLEAAGLSALLAAPAAAQDRGGFLLRAGSDTVGVEQLARGPGELSGRLLLRKRVPVTFQATLRADATIERLTIAVLQPDAPAEALPRQVGTMEFRGDSVIATTRTGDSTKVERFASRPGALAYHAQVPIISLLEQIVRRARVLGGSTVQVPVFLLSGGARTIDATVAFPGPDSAVVSLGSIEARLAVDAAGRVLGGRAQRDQVIERLTAVPDRLLSVRPLDYSAPPGAPYRAEEVRIATPAGHVLAGTLTLPAGARAPVPAVVTITGSSPQDRDNNTPYGGAYRIFRQVADTLGRRGVAVLRLDDRGVAQSTGDIASATTADRADDIRAGIAYLRRRSEVDPRRIALVGLSEGGVIAPMIAATDSTLRGIVLLAGPGSTGREIAEYQLRYQALQADSLAPEARDSLAAREMREMLAVAAARPWERFFLAYDPVPTSRRVRRVPVLILQGTADRNVPPGDAQKLAAAFRGAGNPDVTVRMFEGFNHVFLRDPDGNPRRYGSLPSFTVPAEVLGPLTDWLVERLRR
jgi:dienelactone hydrolase